MNAAALQNQFDAASPFEPAVKPHIKPNVVLRAGELHIIASQAERALKLSNAPFYIRGGVIVRPAVDALPGSSGTPVKVARLVAVQESGLIDHLSRVATWQKFDGRSQKMVPADPTAAVAATILSRDGEWTFPHLAGVITTPTLRPDGTILSEPGYDKTTHLLLIAPPQLPAIPAKPTRADGLAALQLLDGLLDEFTFADDVSRSVALSALITPVVRGAMPVVPMHAIDAKAPGTGKSFLVDVVSTISAGERAPVLSIGRTEEETEKRLGAAIIEGQPLISLDNVNGELGGDFLCQMIERPIVAPRVLGKSLNKKVESRACTFATGNNIQIVGDMTRRALLCSLDANMERPELRTFNGNPVAAVLVNRAKYIAAALIVARSYSVAGSPNTLPPLASFEGWSRVVRSALVWLGRPDPVKSMDKAREGDPVTTALTILFTSWIEIMGTEAKPVGEVIATAELSEPFGNVGRAMFRQALADVATDKSGKIGGAALGKYLGRYKGRIVAGLKLNGFADTHTKQMWWRVERME